MIFGSKTPKEVEIKWMVRIFLIKKVTHLACIGRHPCELMVYLFSRSFLNIIYIGNTYFIRL